MSEFITLITPKGLEIGAYVARPSGEPIAGLVVIQEIFGVNQHIREVADGWANDGFLVVAPAMFDRFEKGVELGYDAEDWKAAMGFAKRLNPVESLDEVGASVAFAAKETGKKVGVIGYCFGGTMAWLSSARLPIAAAVGYYGGYIPNLVAEEPKVPVLLHFGRLDEHIPVAGVEKVAAAHPEVEIEWYEAGHAFNRAADPTAYVPDEAMVARSRSLVFLKKHLA